MGHGFYRWAVGVQILSGSGYRRKSRDCYSLREAEVAGVNNGTFDVRSDLAYEFDKIGAEYATCILNAESVGVSAREGLGRGTNLLRRQRPTR